MSDLLKEIRGYRSIFLGEREEDILSFFFFKNLSAYDILIIYRDDFKEPKGYKDIHHTIKRLEELRLLEQINGKHYRNKKIYKLTSRGLFQVLSNDAFLQPSFLNKRKNELVLQAILYNFFEVRTIMKFITHPRMHILGNYLSNCCHRLLNKIESTRKDGRRVTDDEIESLIANEARDFALQIITSKIRDDSPIAYPYESKLMRKIRIDTDDMEDENGPNYVNLFPKPALRSDAKFIKLLREMKKDFDKGCQEYLIHSN